MNSRDVVVRIIQPAEQAKPQKIEYSPQPAKQEKNLSQAIINGLGLAAIALLGLYLVISFFNLGISINDLVVMVGLPLSVGLVASYAVI
ncbi:MAG: hypothetical protein PHH14_00100 [Candidatus Margulisbacteria bacterium]|nr:hypothetical protein [Candidatus Margulisiibacteriota bacterium]